jgi:hypothetical protein
MSSYIPPNKRNTSRVVPPNPLSSENFPSLGGGTPVRSNAKMSGGSFASKAREWNQQSEEEKLQQYYETQREHARLERERIERNSVFIYHTRYEDDDDESNYSHVEDNTSVQTPKEDEWRIVERKQKAELTSEEKYEKLEKQLEEEEKQKEMDETLLPGNDWDYRDRRAIH